MRLALARLIAGNKYHVVESSRWKQKCDLANEANLLRLHKLPRLEKALDKQTQFFVALRNELESKSNHYSIMYLVKRLKERAAKVQE